MTTAAGYVVTGGGRGVGRAIVERLLADDAYVAVIELEEAALAPVVTGSAGRRPVLPRQRPAGSDRERVVPPGQRTVRERCPTPRDCIPLSGNGRGDEVAPTVAHLLSDASSVISGAVLPIDGGRAAQGQDLEQR